MRESKNNLLEDDMLGELINKIQDSPEVANLKNAYLELGAAIYRTNSLYKDLQNNPKAIKRYEEIGTMLQAIAALDPKNILKSLENILLYQLPNKKSLVYSALKSFKEFMEEVTTEYKEIIDLQADNFVDCSQVSFFYNQAEKRLQRGLTVVELIPYYLGQDESAILGYSKLIKFLEDPNLSIEAKIKKISSLRYSSQYAPLNEAILTFAQESSEDFSRALIEMEETGRDRRWWLNLLVEFLNNRPDTLTLACMDILNDPDKSDSMKLGIINLFCLKIPAEVFSAFKARDLEAFEIAVRNVQASYEEENDNETYSGKGVC